MPFYKFAIHGKFELEVDDRIIILSGEGPGNAEVIDDYSQKVEPLVDELKDAPWVHIFNVKGLAITTPEARHLMLLSAIKGMSRGLAATAIIIQDSEFTLSTRQFWASIYEEAKLEHGFFESVAEAKTWANQLLANKH